MSSESTEVKADGKDPEDCGGCRGGRRFKFFIIPMIMLAVVGKSALFMVLWNVLIPQIFHGPEIKFLQAVGLLILAKLLFGFHGGRHGWRGKFGRHHAMRKRFWARMSDQERGELREHLRKRWKE